MNFGVDANRLMSLHFSFHCRLWCFQCISLNTEHYGF